MATRLKETDLVVIGLGAVGGVAVLPITQAGIDVVALEAGTWLSKQDFAPDELRNNYRDWPQAVQKAQHEIPTQRVLGQTIRASSHPMMNAVGVKRRCVLSTALTAFSIGFIARSAFVVPVHPAALA